jgi:hypothetical protein
MKSHSAPIQPTMNLDTAAKTLNTQTDLKSAELEEICYLDFQFPNKRWSTKPTAPYVTSFAEGLLKSVYDRSKKYEARRVGQREFQVHYEQNETYEDTEDYEDFSDVPIPLFVRVRDVTINEEGTMQCSCHKFSCRGYFCEHQVAVADSICQANGDFFNGFTHHDVSVRWHSSYMHLAYKKTTPNLLQKMFHRLAVKDIDGPTFIKDIPESFEIQEGVVHATALDRLKNYKKEDVDLSFCDGLSQSTFLPTNLDDEDQDELFNRITSDLEEKGGLIGKEMDLMFDDSIHNAIIPITSDSTARVALKAMYECTSTLADRLGLKGVQIMEKGFNEMQSEMHNHLREKNEENMNHCKKRKFEPMTQDSYTGTKKRIHNTYHMP